MRVDNQAYWQPIADNGVNYEYASFNTDATQVVWMVDSSSREIISRFDDDTIAWQYTNLSVIPPRPPA
jgi:hypothetical protein